MSVRALLLPADTHRYRHDVDKNTSSRISAGLRRSRSILMLFSSLPFAQEHYRGKSLEGILWEKNKVIRATSQNVSG